MVEHGKHRTLVTRTASACLATLGIAGACGAAECRLALVLAIDVSSSVDAAEDALQRNGLAAALLAPEVQAAIFAADLPVALTAFEWSGRYNQDTLVPWTLLDSPGTLLGVAQQIAGSTRSYAEFPTAMGYALGHAAGLFDTGPDCLFRTVDVAGDGENNEGFTPQHAYRHFPFTDVTVNGLVIDTPEYTAEQSLVDYYRTEVRHGPGAFIETADGFDDYERAMRRKLERELRPRVIGGLGENQVFDEG